MDNISSVDSRNEKKPADAHVSGKDSKGTAIPKGRAAESSTPHGSMSESERKVGVERTEALTKQLNSALAQIDGNYSVSVDDDTGMVVVRITDTDTGELVKQVPPQQVLDVSVSVDKIIGLLVNDLA